MTQWFNGMPKKSLHHFSFSEDKTKEYLEIEGDIFIVNTKNGINPTSGDRHSMLWFSHRPDYKKKVISREISVL